MLVADLITDEIPPLKQTDSIELALDWMEQFKVSHLAVVKGKELIGLVSEHDLIDYQNPTESIEQLKAPLLKPIIHNYQHTYDLLKLMMSFNLTLIPVLDDKELYKGCITLKGTITKYFHHGFSSRYRWCHCIRSKSSRLFISPNFLVS